MSWADGGEPVADTTQNSVFANFTTSVDASVHFVLLIPGETPPTTGEQIRAGHNGDDVAAFAADTVSATADVEDTVSFDSLDEYPNGHPYYSLYWVVESGGGFDLAGFDPAAFDSSGFDLGELTDLGSEDRLFLELLGSLFVECTTLDGVEPEDIKLYDAQIGDVVIHPLVDSESQPVGVSSAGFVVTVDGPLEASFEWDKYLVGSGWQGAELFEWGGASELTADSLVAGAPVLGTPLLQDIAPGDLVANDLAAGAPVLGDPTLVQEHELTADSLVSSAPVVGSPTLGLAENKPPVWIGGEARVFRVQLVE